MQVQSLVHVPSVRRSDAGLAPQGQVVATPQWSCTELPKRGGSQHSSAALLSLVGAQATTARNRLAAKC